MCFDAFTITGFVVSALVVVAIIIAGTRQQPSE